MNIKRSLFNEKSLETDFLEEVAVILFISPSNFAYKSDTKLTSDFNLITENETVISLSNLRKYGATLIVNAEDLDESIGDSMPVATYSDLVNIDNFLMANADKEIISVCDAGVARSGFISWYLDKVNNVTRDWEQLSPSIRGEQVEYHSKYFHAITSPELTRLGELHLTKKGLL